MGQKTHRFVGSRIIQTFYLLISITIILLGLFFYLHQKKILKASINNELESVALLKVNEINTWLKERIADANVFTQSPMFRNYFQQFIKNRNSLSLNILNDKIHLLKTQYEYEDVLLVDRIGNVILNTNQNNNHRCNDLKPYLKIALDAEQTIITDFNWSDQKQKIYLDFITPIYSTIANKEKENIGFLILRCDPNTYLYPLINKWPTNSKTAETLLARKDGDSVVFINNIRHAKNSALRLRISLTQTNVPAVRGALGFYGIYEGVDYRKRTVLSYILKVPETNWFMVSKVDTSEIYQPLRIQAWIFGIILMLVLTLIGLILSVVQNSIQKNIYKKLLDLEIERKALISHFEYLFKYANDIITLLDKDLKVVEANDKALIAYGYTRDEMIGMDGKLLRSSIGQTFLEHIKAIQNKGSHLYEAVNRRKDGSEFPVEVSARSIEIEGHKYYQFIARNITERKQAEKALKISAKRFEALLSQAPFTGVIYRLILNNTGEITDWEITDINELGASSIGLEKSTAIGKRALTLFDAQVMAPYFEIAQQVKASGKPQTFETYFEANKRFYLTSVFFVDHDHYANMSIDITDRKQAEEQIRNQLDELQRWQKVTIGREDRTRELKQEVNELLVRLGEAIRYPSQKGNIAKQ